MAFTSSLTIEGLYDEHLSFWNIDEKFVNDTVSKHRQVDF